MIYVLCPYKLITGGPDALHQLVFYLNSINKEAKIVYYDVKKRNLEIPEQYKCYVDEYGLYSDIIDDESNSIISSEMNSYLLRKFKDIKKYMWWLSVDAYFYHLSPYTKLKILLFKFPLGVIKRTFTHSLSLYLRHIKSVMHERKVDFKDEKITHLWASYYAENFLKKQGAINTYKCIEPISKYFLDKYEKCDLTGERSNTILYNPAKSKEAIEAFKKHFSDLEFLPLTGYSQEQLVDKYLHSKLYIDFGNFQGAERIPKEAALFGCEIITGRRGASNYYGDVRIDDKYKFESYQEYDKIYRTIKHLLFDYANCIDEFKEYKTMVLNLESEFIQSLNDIFGL